MTIEMKSGIKLSTNGINIDDCADPVQTLNALRLLSNSGKRLSSWIIKQLNAHNDRVSALGVYRRQRVDAHQPLSGKAAHRASK